MLMLSHLLHKSFATSQLSPFSNLTLHLGLSHLMTYSSSCSCSFGEEKQEPILMGLLKMDEFAWNCLDALDAVCWIR